MLSDSDFKGKGEVVPPQILPPWLWLWLILYILTLPNSSLLSLPADLKPMFRMLLLTMRPSGELMGGASATISWLLIIIPTFFEFVLYLVVFIGVLLVFLPWIRAVYVEATEKLILPPDSVPAINEISEFVGQYFPGIQVRANLERVRSRKIFVYPRGYRTYALGLHGGFLKLWRGDKSIAQAILLHEIAHYRQGDALILGVGSFFEQFMSKWWRLYLFLVLVPAVLIIVIQSVETWINVSEINKIGHDADLSSSFFDLASQFFMHEINVLFGITLPGLLSVFLVTLFTTAITLLLPWACIWYAELSADRFVAVAMQQSSENMIQALEISGHVRKPSRLASLWKSFLSSVSHPPITIRKWMALRVNRTSTLFILFSILPLAVIFRLLMLTVMASTTTLSGQEIIKLIKNYLSGPVLWLCLPMGVIILLWPLIAPYWEWLFFRKKERLNWSGYRAHLLAASLLAMFVVGCIVAGRDLPTDDSQTADTHSETQHVKVGEIATLSGLEIVVPGWEKIEGDKFLTPEPGKEFVAVEVIVNTGQEVQSISTVLNMKLRDSQGQEYKLRPELEMLMESKAPQTRVAVGEKLRGKVGFEVSSEAKGLAFYFGYLDLGRSHIVVDLGDVPVKVALPENLAEETISPYKPGDIIQIDGLELVVNEVSLPLGKGIALPKKGYEFLAVDFTIKNKNNKTVRLHPLDFEMKDSIGRLYGVDIHATFAAGINKMPIFKVSPGQKINARLGYEVPINTETLFFSLKRPYPGGKVFVQLSR